MPKDFNIVRKENSDPHPSVLVSCCWLFLLLGDTWQSGRRCVCVLWSCLLARTITPINCLTRVMLVGPLCAARGCPWSSWSGASARAVCLAGVKGRWGWLPSDIWPSVGSRAASGVHQTSPVGQRQSASWLVTAF